jgi:glyoxylase-like metal-dependent hydrolase (beta-lactamase superfamily II)
MEGSSTSALGATVRVSAHGNVKVHTFISPEDSFLVNTQIVEGPNNLIIFDGQLFLPNARAAAIYANSLAKPVERIILSHIHLDHWGGLSVFAEHFPHVKVHGLPGIADYLRENGHKILDARRSAFGDKIPTGPTIPTEVLPEGKVTIDGVIFEFKRYVDAEAAIQLVAFMPDQQTLLGFDLVFASNEHVFTIIPHFENWIRILEELNTLSDYNRILSGHGEPTDRMAIDATIAYLRKGKETYNSTNDAGTYATEMKAAFPDRQHPAWIDFSASLLYNVVYAY